MAFGCDKELENDIPIDICWTELYCARAKYGDDMSHETALKALGYELE